MQITRSSRGGQQHKQPREKRVMYGSFVSRALDEAAQAQFRRPQSRPHSPIRARRHRHPSRSANSGPRLRVRERRKPDKLHRTAPRKRHKRSHAVLAEKDHLLGGRRREREPGARRTKPHRKNVRPMPQHLIQRPERRARPQRETHDEGVEPRRSRLRAGRASKMEMSPVSNGTVSAPGVSDSADASAGAQPTTSRMRGRGRGGGSLSSARKERRRQLRQWHCGRAK
jgi:hypothetical protein